MKEALSGECINEKEKVMFPEIVVRGTKDKPYYAIKYYDVADNDWHLGYGSYNLEYVMQWKEECLEVVEGDIKKGAFEKIIERLEEAKKLAYNTYDNYKMNVDLCRGFGVEKAIEIVNEVAEEYCNGIGIYYNAFSMEDQVELFKGGFKDCSKCRWL